jgi:hypothetical protein
LPDKAEWRLIEATMRSKVLGTIVVVQFVVICALGFLLLQGGRPTAEREKVETALTDIHGTLSVGANFTQLQEKVQALAATIDNFRAKGGGGSELVRFEQSLKLYKDSLDLWSDELSNSWRYEKKVGDRFGYAPAPLERIAKEQSYDISQSGIHYKIFADELLQQLWAKADEAGRGVKTEKEQPKK